jgi:tetratricopeptide (TPR) repeat protein
LKTRFLEGVSLMNMDRLDRALEVFRGISAEAQEIRSERLLAIACNNLVQIHGMMGKTEEALEEAQGTLRLLYKLDNKIGLAKLQWGVGTVLKTRGNLDAAREAFASAQSGFEALGMQSDVAALHLVLADLCLEIGEESGARRHVLDALPIIESEKMVPEGVAALTLLQESVRQKAINRSALRDLHGYFDELRAR